MVPTLTALNTVCDSLNIVNPLVPELFHHLPSK